MINPLHFDVTLADEQTMTCGWARRTLRQIGKQFILHFSNLKIPRVNLSNHLLWAYIVILKC